ncbi:hypothetical protein Vadar_002304 [Vaccinium darrowii]|uniref:Uncharacterized protein n=1 Tax=Vaccinium darrowii TaxID=229202 RepID=A0ACB7XMN4_9ERIC|nr:hypothetical protein Vadar_002304 [Vaccinium darrowii]
MTEDSQSQFESPLKLPREGAETNTSDHYSHSCFKGHHKAQKVQEEAKDKSFWGAVGLIIGTAVGPGMLGLPAATIRSGPLPSTIAILLSWVYVISSIILVAELSFAAMEEDNVSEWFPLIDPIIANALFPFVVGIILWFFPFKVIDAANRFLCLVMLFSISALDAVGLLVGRMNILGSFAHASWDLSSVLPAIPVTVLTLGFHVITPFICKIAGNSINDARRAILFGGVVPLVMVLLWNLIVLGLAGTNTVPSSRDPISLLLSVNPSALSAVQGFAFSALATSLIGYAVSFPKQRFDTVELIFRKPNSCVLLRLVVEKSGLPLTQVAMITELWASVPVLIASFFRSTFSRALDFAGVYANCFLFGILPPVMAYIYQSRRRIRSSILPEGRGALVLLFVIAVILEKEVRTSDPTAFAFSIGICTHYSGELIMLSKAP